MRKEQKKIAAEQKKVDAKAEDYIRRICVTVTG